MIYCIIFNNYNELMECECLIIFKPYWENKKTDEDHNNKNCKSCYCKASRGEISFEEYDNICMLSKKNCGRKFKEVCMICQE